MPGLLIYEFPIFFASFPLTFEFERQPVFVLFGHLLYPNACFTKNHIPQHEWIIFGNNASNFHPWYLHKTKEDDRVFELRLSMPCLGVFEKVHCSKTKAMIWDDRPLSVSLTVSNDTMVLNSAPLFIVHLSSIQTSCHGLFLMPKEFSFVLRISKPKELWIHRQALTSIRWDSNINRTIFPRCENQVTHSVLQLSLPILIFPSSAPSWIPTTSSTSKES